MFENYGLKVSVTARPATRLYPITPLLGKFQDKHLIYPETPAVDQRAKFASNGKNCFPSQTWASSYPRRFKSRRMAVSQLTRQEAQGSVFE